MIRACLIKQSGFKARSGDSLDTRWRIWERVMMTIFWNSSVMTSFFMSFAGA
jgi:hypothetical protein